MEHRIGREQANPQCEVRWQVQLGQLNAYARPWMGRCWFSVPATPESAVGAPRGRMMVSPSAGVRAGVACPHRLHTLAPDRRRPPQEGVEHVTRSMATKRAQVSKSTTKPM